MTKRKAGRKSTGPTETARRIWLAGLGALAAAEEEGAKVFDGLVKRGRGVERSLAEPIEGATRRVRSTLGDVRSRAGRAFDQVGRAVDDGVNATLERIGIVSRRQLSELGRRVEKLGSRLATAPERPKRARKKAAPRRATRPVAKSD